MKVWCLTVMALVYLPAWAQKLPDKIRFEQVPVTGTIQSSITEDIMQDPYGMIWVGKNMLYRFNGKDFTKYGTILPDSSGFGMRDITRLHWDVKGNRLLVGTRYQGLLQYDYQSDRVKKIPTDGQPPIINEIVQTRDGVIWVSSFTSGFYHLEHDTLKKAGEAFEGLQPTSMMAVGNQIWAGCQNEILIFSGSEIKKRISLDAFVEYLPNAIRAHAMMLDHHGRLWLGTERDGVIVLDTLRFELIKKFSPKQKPFYSSITRIAEDDHHLIWILTKGDGVILYSPEQDSFIQTTHHETDKSALSGDHCTSVCIDRTGIVWIGAAGALNKYDRTKIKFQHINYTPGSPLSLSDDNIRSVYEDEKGIIYLATSGGYLNIVDRAKGVTKKVKIELPGYTSFVTPLSILKKDGRSLYVGSSIGLLQYDLTNGRFSFFRPLEKYTRGLPVRQLISKGEILYLIVRGQLVKYNTKTGHTEEYTKKHSIDNASHVSVDSTGRLWVGVNQGLAYRNLQQENFTVINLRDKKFRPDSSYFLALTIKQIDDHMWVSMFNQGIYVFNLNAQPTLTDRLTTATGLPDNTVYSTLPDRSGAIWMSHNGGLSKYFPREKKFIHFSVSEGLQDEEFNRLAYFQSRLGDIIVGGINGINIFDPAKIVPSKVNVDIQIQGLRVLSLESSSPSLISLIGKREIAELDHSHNSVLFEFFVPDFQEPVRYAIFYRLEPFDKGWHETENFFSPTYANLPSGEYTFYAKAVGPAGEEKVAKTTFVVLPPFWKTWWFIIIVFFLFCCLIYATIFIRVQSTEAARKRLESLLKIRTQEIVRSREELENLNKKKDLIFSILSHDLRSPLTTLKGFLGLLIENSDALSREDLKKFAFSIRNSVTNSLDLIDNTLFWSLSQTGNIQCTPTAVLLGPMFEKVKGLYQLTAEKKQIQLHFMNSNGLMAKVDENMLYVLVRNLISNALKFTPEGKSVYVEAMQQGGWISIRVNDQGVGMSSEEIENIFESDNPLLKRGTSSEKGTGIGLALCKKFVDMNHGRLLIESKEGIGSQFTVLLPKA